MSGINKAIVVGRLGSDPEVKTTSGGHNVARLSVATSERWNNSEGQRQERTEWHRVVVWGKMAELCGRYLSKGRQIYVEGRLQTRSWEDQQGLKRYSTEIVARDIQFLGDATRSQDTQGDRAHSSAPVGNGEVSASKPAFNAEQNFDQNEEIPF